jgi:hypothetical protein
VVRRVMSWKYEEIEKSRRKKKKENTSHQIRINGKEGKREITQKTKLDGVMVNSLNERIVLLFLR